MPIISDIAGFSRPITKLIQVVAAGCGRAYDPKYTTNMALAQAEAEKIKAKSDIEIQEWRQRAQQREADRSVRRQRNVEGIADKAQKYLPSNVSDDPVDDDWAFEFFEQCQDTSNESLQELWAKLLAGEVANPGHCSKRTLRIVRSMSKADAEAFTRICQCICEVTSTLFVIPTELYAVPQLGLDATTLDELDSLGLIRTERVHILTRPKVGHIQFFDRTVCLYTDKAVSIPYIGLTRRGAELREVVEAKPNERYLELMILELQNLGIHVAFQIPNWAT